MSWPSLKSRRSSSRSVARLEKAIREPFVLIKGLYEEAFPDAGAEALDRLTSVTLPEVRSNRKTFAKRRGLSWPGTRSGSVLTKATNRPSPLIVGEWASLGAVAEPW